MARSLQNCLGSVLEELFKSNEEVRKQYKTAQLEDLFQEVVEDVFKNAAFLVLQHVNAVYLFEEKGIRQLVVYTDDSSVRSSLDARQGLLKIFLLKRGISYDAAKFLPSQRSIKMRHPYKNAKTRPLEAEIRELTAEELKEAEEFASFIEDEMVKEAFKKAYISDLQTRKK